MSESLSPDTCPDRQGRLSSCRFGPARCRRNRPRLEARSGSAARRLESRALSFALHSQRDTCAGSLVMSDVLRLARDLTCAHSQNLQLTAFSITSFGPAPRRLRTMRTPRTAPQPSPAWLIGSVCEVSWIDSKNCRCRRPPAPQPIPPTDLFPHWWLFLHRRQVHAGAGMMGRTACFPLFLHQ